MCIWDQLQTKARRVKPRAFIDLTEPERREVLELPELWGRAQEFYIEARLGTTFNISSELLNAQPETKQKFLEMAERNAREQMARMLYEEIIEKVEGVIHAILDEKPKHECLHLCEELIEYMTNDDKRPHGTEECHDSP